MMLERLKRMPLFGTLSEADLEIVAQSLVTEQVEANVTIMEQGEQGNRFYLIVRGKVEVVQDGEEGSRSLAILEEGGHFGEMALLKQIPRTATVRTLAPCLFLTMNGEWFQKVIELSPQLRVQFERSYEERMLKQG